MRLSFCLCFRSFRVCRDTSATLLEYVYSFCMLRSLVFFLLATRWIGNPWSSISGFHRLTFKVSLLWLSSIFLISSLKAALRSYINYWRLLSCCLSTEAAFTSGIYFGFIYNSEEFCYFRLGLFSNFLWTHLWFWL